MIDKIFVGIEVAMAIWIWSLIFFPKLAKNAIVWFVTSLPMLAISVYHVGIGDAFFAAIWSGCFSFTLFLSSKKAEEELKKLHNQEAKIISQEARDYKWLLRGVIARINGEFDHPTLKGRDVTPDAAQDAYEIAREAFPEWNEEEEDILP